METQEQKPDVNAAAQAELHISDVQNLCAIVDMAIRRGAFGANEISAVGSVYDRVSAFLNSVTPKQDGNAANTQPSQK